MCTTDKTHVHKDLKQLVLNVTDNTTEKLICKKTKTKCKPKQKQECPQAKSSPIKVPQQPSQNAEDQGKLSTKEGQSKCIRALAHAFNDVEDMISEYNFEAKS